MQERFRGKGTGPAELLLECRCAGQEQLFLRLYAHLVRKIIKVLEKSLLVSLLRGSQHRVWHFQGLQRENPTRNVGALNYGQLPHPRAKVLHRRTQKDELVVSR